MLSGYIKAMIFKDLTLDEIAEYIRLNPGMLIRDMAWDSDIDWFETSGDCYYSSGSVPNLIIEGRDSLSNLEPTYITDNNKDDYYLVYTETDFYRDILKI